MRSARWPSARNICARRAGRAGFPEVLQIFRALFAQNLRHLDAAFARYLALECAPTQIKSCNKGLRFAQPRWPSSRNFCARGAPKFFGDSVNSFFARVRHKICVIPTLDAFFFGSECNSDSINSQRRYEVCTAHVGRAHAIFLTCAGRAEIPKILQIFRVIFALNFASPRRWTRAFSCIRTHAHSEQSCNEVLRCAQPRFPSSRNFCARGAPKFFGDFAILSRELGAK